MKPSLLILPLVFAAHTAAAQDLSTPDSRWYIQVGPAALAFKESAKISAGGSEIPGAGVTLSDNKSLVANIGYFITPSVSLAAMIGIPPTTKVDGTGPLAGLRAGEITYGPSMFTANYHFRQFGKFQPFIGAGFTYTAILDTKDGAIQDLKVDNALGGAIRAGFDYMLSERNGFYMSAQKLFVGTDVNGTVNPAIPGLGGAPIKASIDLDPLIISAGYTVRF